MVDRREGRSRIPWLLRAIWNPVDAFDLYDKDGLSDHEKLVPFMFLVFACVMQAVHNPLSWYAILALGSLSFGYGAWRMFLKSRSVTGTITDDIKSSVSRTDVNITKTLRVERDPVEGVDPA